MPNIDILVLAIVQGVTEFLPISSSGHLVLIPQFFCWADQSQAMALAAHAGILLAALAYFWRELFAMTRGLYKVARGKRDPGARLVMLLLVAAIPALIIGFLLDLLVGDYLRSAEIVGWNLIIWGVILYVADKIGLTVRRMEHLNAGQALIIGVFQCLAFMPGASRSGLTMTVARILGYERIAAARFSFLLAIPTIAAAGLYEGYNLLQAPEPPQMMQQLVLMAAGSAVTGFLAIAFMMYWLRRSGFGVFVIYRILLGAVVLYLTYRLPGGIEGICAAVN